MSWSDAGPSLVICGVCGLALTDDPDDQRDHPTGPVCGPCTRAREFDQTLWEAAWHEDRGPW